MLRLRFLGLAWCSVAACVTASSADARLADRPISCQDGYCCPYGLGQWEGRPHRYVYSDYGNGEVGDACPAMTAPLPMVVDEPREAMGAQTPPGEFYDDIGNSNFDCPYREPCHAPATEGATTENHPGCRGEETCEPQTCEPWPCETQWYDDTPADHHGANPVPSLGGLAETTHWRHCAGLWIVDHLNAEHDGLDETVAGELDWAAIAAEFEAREAELEVQGPPADSGACGGDADEASHEPRRLREWCGEVWGAVRQAAQRVSRRLGALAERITPVPATGGDEPTVETEAENVETVEPQIEVARPPLPDYFLPAFGSPWDGEL